jgi:hypothetical protein
MGMYGDYFTENTKSKTAKSKSKKGGDGKNMTLDDAIDHLDELLAPGGRLSDCSKCREEHMLLRQWLIELRDYRNADKR